MPECSERELGVMAHATAWNHPRDPLCRNRYVAFADCITYDVCVDLVRRGLMRATSNPEPQHGESTVFEVTPAGFEALDHHLGPLPRRK